MALRTPGVYDTPLTPGYDAYGGAAASAAGSTAPTSLFVATERAAAADAQLQRDARVESLQRRWAEVCARKRASALIGAQQPRWALTAAPYRRPAVATQVASAYNDWLQDTLLLVSERWPVLDGNSRLDVRAPGARLAARRAFNSSALTLLVARARVSVTLHTRQVTTVNDVVLYDVRTLSPYRASLEADDAVRARRLAVCSPMQRR